jgi:predicted nucleotide-binding protein
MATATKTYDVFISHSAADKATARQVAKSLEAAGLATFHLDLIQSGENISEEVWEALAESHALIAIVSPDDVTSANVILEIGAASAWNKPVFLSSQQA